MLNSDELAQLRALQQENMPEICSIKRPAGTSDSAGGQSDAEITAATNVPCRVRSSAKDARARAVADRLGVALAYVVALPAGQAVREQDQLLITGRSIRFRVVAAPVESVETARFCDCVEVR